MTNILSHLRPRDEAVAEGSNGVSATPDDENVERSEAVIATETMDGSEARAAILSVIRTNCFACAVSDDDEKKEGEEVEEEIQPRNLGNSSSGVSDVQSGEKEKKKKDALDLGETSTKPNWWQNILGASSAGVSDVPKKDEKLKDVLDSGEISSNRPNSRRRARPNPRLSNPPNHLNGELVAAGWPSWLSAVAGEAIYGWTPRRADTFEKIDKIGQGLHSNVYKSRDVMTGKIVALKKVRFDNLEPESVKFMAREILVLRRLDHPNIMKLEGLVTSKMSCSLYLVFEYMEHDLAGLAENPGIQFTEPQVKCYMYQLLLGLQYCHSHGVLHRNINGSNLLINNGGILKIAGFGSASFLGPDRKLPMTSRVTTLWYRPPELLMGASDYGVGVDLWSMGCVLAELLAGKPIMPGRTEVEQLIKIFKLCGSPSEEYWKKSKLPHASIFKPQQPYKRCIAETFKDFPPSSLPLIETLLAIDPAERQTATAALMSEFFTTKPYACEPSSLLQYPPSKEMDAKLRVEEGRRLRAAGGKANGDGVKKTRGRDRPVRAMPAPEANAELQANLDRRRLITHANAKSKSEKFPPLHQDGALGFPLGSSHHMDSAFDPPDVPYSSTTFTYQKGPVERQTATAALRSEFFTVEPYACEPSDLPKYPSKEDVDAKHQAEKARHRASGGKPNVDGQKKIRTRDRAVRAIPGSEASVELQTNTEMKRNLSTILKHEDMKFERFPSLTWNINKVDTKTSFRKKLSNEDRFRILGSSGGKLSGLHADTWKWSFVDGS